MNAFRAIVFYHMGAIFCITKGVHRIASTSSYVVSGIHKVTLQLSNRVTTRKEWESTIEIKKKTSELCASASYCTRCLPQHPNPS